MTIARVEVMGSAERRRRWSRSEKERLVAAALRPGVSTSEVARAAGIHVSQLFRWRNELCGRRTAPAPRLVPVEIADEPAALSAPLPMGMPAPPERTGVIEIDLGAGVRIRVDRDVDAVALRRVLDVLGGQ